METETLSVQVADYENPYRDLILWAIQNEFPAAIGTDRVAILEAVSRELIGTGQVRYGPIPGPESLVAIRNVLRTWISRDLPIPILIPWGSKKPTNQGIDIAEVMALKTLQCLQNRIIRFYPPGLAINIRIEDIGGHFLFADQGVAALQASEAYVYDAVTLANVLNLNFITPVLESSLVDERAFIAFATELTPHFVRYLERTDLYGIPATGPTELEQIGWTGTIPLEFRDFYRLQYAKWEPESTPTERNLRLARYLASALARHKLKATGANSAWGRDFIQLCFTPEAPGTPPAIGDRRIYYRTVPKKYGETHIAPWRAKGYLKIEGRNAVPKIASWYNGGIHYNPCVVQFKRRGWSVNVRADYKIGGDTGFHKGD